MHASPASATSTVKATETPLDNDFTGRYTDNAFTKLLDYYSKRKNDAKVQLVIADSAKDLEAIKQFEQEQKALSSSAERTRSRLIVMMPFKADSITRWSLTTFEYATPKSKAIVHYYDPCGDKIPVVLTKAISASTQAKAGEESYNVIGPTLSITSDADTIILEMARYFMEFGELVSPTHIIPLQARNMHEVDYGIMQSLASRKRSSDPSILDDTTLALSASTEGAGAGAGAAATPAVAPSPVRFTGELTKERLQELAITAAKAGNTQFLEILLNVELDIANRSSPVKKLLTTEDLDKHEIDQYLYFKEKWEVQIPLRLADTRKVFLKSVIDGTVAIDSNESLIIRLNANITEVIENMVTEFRAHLVETGQFKKSPEFAENEVVEFREMVQLVIQHEKLTKRFTTTDRKLNPIENAKRILANVESKMQDGIELMVKLQPKAIEISEFHGRWLNQGTHKMRLFNVLVTQYQSKDGVIRSWEDIPLDFTRLTSDEKNCIYTALLDINFKDNEGNTLLHHAISKGQLNLIHCLLLLGAKPNIPNNSGETAVTLAERIGFLSSMALLDPSSPAVNAIQSGLGSCISFIQTMTVQLKVFRDRSDVILRNLAKTGFRDFHHLAYSLREMDILIIREKLAAIEASCNLVGGHIYTEVPALMDQLVLFSFDMMMQINSMEKAIKELEGGLVGETPTLQAYMHALNEVRVGLLRGIDKALTTLLSNPAFEDMHRVARDLKAASPHSAEVFNIAKIEEQAALTIAIANERVLALLRERNATVVELQAKIAAITVERDAATGTVTTFKENLMRLETENTRLRESLSHIGASGSAHTAMMVSAAEMPISSAAATVFAEALSTPGAEHTTSTAP